MIYAVIDTNVLVSALITKNPEAATAKVVRLLLDNGFVPLYDADIVTEYEDVLHRDWQHYNYGADKNSQAGTGNERRTEIHHSGLG